MVTDRVEILLVFGFAIVMVALAMGAMHEGHYRKRRERMFEARLGALEQMYLEDRRA